MFALAPFSPLLSLPKPYHPPPNPQFLRRQQTLTLTNSTKLTVSTAIAVDFASDGGDDDWEEEEDGDEDEEEEVEEEEEFVAFEDMRKWEMNKPAGFGEGKVYDTTVEEQLLEEMERTASAARVDGKSRLKSDLKKQELQSKALEIPRGPCVRLGNLPKKKNIHRDLRAAFKDFPGIVNINPSVSGNWKTRDPICRGFAFIELVSEEAANGFVRTYSKQNILFGKVEKQISCEVLKPLQVADETRTLNRQIATVVVDESSNSTTGWLKDSERRELSVEHSNVSPLHDAVDLQKQKKKPSKKKKVVKTKQLKSSKSTVSGSMARLKIKERSVLTGVFSKYGVKAASASD